MEIKINQLIGKSASRFIASRMELGDNAGAITWNNSKREASCLEPELMTTEQCDEYRKVLKSYGAWPEEELASMSKIELQALLIQEVMGGVRDSGAMYLDEIDWAEYQEKAEAGQIIGRLFKSGEDYYIQLDA